MIKQKNVDIFPHNDEKNVWVFFSKEKGPKRIFLLNLINLKNSVQTLVMISEKFVFFYPPNEIHHEDVSGSKTHL